MSLLRINLPDYVKKATSAIIGGLRGVSRSFHPYIRSLNDSKLSFISSFGV